MLENFASTIMSNYSATNCNHVFTWIINEQRVFTSLCGILFSCMRINCNFLHDIIKWHWWQAGRHFFMHFYWYFVETVICIYCLHHVQLRVLAVNERCSTIQISQSIQSKRINFEYLKTFMLIYTQHFYVRHVWQSLSYCGSIKPYSNY